jgi:hypothetical protein
MNTTNHESEAYNSGWLAGYDALVADLYEGFNGDLPGWLLAELGGKKAVASALKAAEGFAEGKIDGEFMGDPDYDCGETDGYDELLVDVEEAFEQRKAEMPKFLRELVGGGK